jgi:hypothetical protein
MGLKGQSDKKVHEFWSKLRLDNCFYNFKIIRLKALIFQTGEALDVKSVSRICKLLLQTTASYSGSH